MNKQTVSKPSKKDASKDVQKDLSESYHLDQMAPTRITATCQSNYSNPRCKHKTTTLLNSPPTTSIPKNPPKMRTPIQTLHLHKRSLSSISSPKLHLPLEPQPPLRRTTVPLRSLARLTPTASSFSTQTPHLALSSKSSPVKPGSAKTHESDQDGEVQAQAEALSVSFEGLGISRNMKVVLLVILGVFGSIETYFWCRAVWTWWRGGEEGDGQE